MLKNILIVGAGGAVGAMARYALGGLVLHHTQNTRFPFSTLAVNLAGCLLMGILAGLAEVQHLFSRELRLLLMVGLLGGFTTFSAFGFETVYLLKRGAPLIACANVLVSVGGGVLLLWIGMAVVELVYR